MKYFDLTWDIETGKRTFLHLSKLLHPDRNTSPDANNEMTLLNREYEAFKTIKLYWDEIVRAIPAQYVPVPVPYHGPVTEQEMKLVDLKEMNDLLDNVFNIVGGSRKLGREIKEIIETVKNRPS